MKKLLGTGWAPSGFAVALPVGLALLSGLALSDEGLPVPVTAEGVPPPGVVLRSELTPSDLLVKKAMRFGADIAAKFDGPMGLQGYVVSMGGGREQIVYTDRAGQFLIHGSIFNAEGKNVTKEALEDFQSKQPQLDRTPLILDAAKTSWVEEGSGGGVVYVIADANCGYCKRLYDALREPVQRGHLRVRWIMVGMLTDTSEAKALEILAARATPKRLPEVLARYMSSASAASAKPVANFSPSVQVNNDYAKNMGFFNANRFNGTPAVIYRKQGGRVVVHNGMPKSDEMVQMIRDAAP